MNAKLFNTFVAASVVLLAAISGRAQSAYSNAVTSLSPAGYWPMHEVETAAQGDIETNYGTLGPLGEGFYPDWAGATVGIIRGVPGVVTNDNGKAVNYIHAANTPNGSYTNDLYVPHTSPLTTLRPPFSVECWFYPTNATSEDVWAQNGSEGLNAGNAGVGNGANDGIRLVWANGNGAAEKTGFELFVCDGTQNTAGFTGNTNLNGNLNYGPTNQFSPFNNWYDVVVTCDANTNWSVYINGVLAPLNSQAGIANGPGSYTPDYWTPITIGGGKGGSRSVSGYIDEFSVYTNVISDIPTHYNDAINGAAGQYSHDVTNDNPVVYLRMNAAAYSPPAVGTWPVLTSYGTTNGVAVGNGVYSPGTAPGLVTSSPVNPNGRSFGGVSANLVPLNGISSLGDAGNAAAFNPTGSNASFTVSALFRGYPCDNRVQCIVGHGTNSWELDVTTNGCLVFNAGNGMQGAGVSAGYGSASGDMRTIGVYNDGNWHQVVAINQTNLVSIYVDGVLDTNGTPTGVTTTNLIFGNNNDVAIGADLSYTNNPPGAGRQFAGQICEVAFWTNALVASQIQTLYSNCEVVPFIKAQPVSAAVNLGTTFTNFVVAGGGPVLAYQWFTNGVALVGQTSANLILNPVVASSASTNYYLVVTNLYGSATSAVVSLTVFGPPAYTKQLPVTYSNVLNTNFLTLYAGANPNFSVSAIGAQPIAYYWFTNGVNCGGQNNNNLTCTNVQIGTLNVYCVASNFVNMTTSAVWTASVVADPTNSSNGLAPYPQQVLADNPIGYWRLNEPDCCNNSGPNNGTVSLDYAGGNDGIYTNVVLSDTGYSPTTDPSDSAADFGVFNGASVPDEYAGKVQGIDFAGTNVNAEFTVEAWASGDNFGLYVPTPLAPLATKGIEGVDDEFNLGVDSTKLHYQFYVRSASGTVYTVGSGSSAAVDNNWHHVVGVCDEANGQLLLYYDGRLINTAAIPTNSGVYEAHEPMSIGAGTADGVNYGNQFVGDINDVAVYNHALSINQVMAQYSSVVPGGIQPYFIQAPPSSVLVASVGNTLAIAATAGGSTPIGYYWTDEGGGATNVAAGATNGLPLNASLTYTNVPAAWNNDQLELTVTNASGSISTDVSLIVSTNVPIIALTLNLPTPVTVISGKSYVYSIGATGPTPFSYQWFNAGTLISGATNTTYTVTAGSPGNTTYYVVVTNLVGVITSTVSTFTSINALAAPTFAYATNLLQLNPAGYWPMHETEAAAQGDVEVNYGSLGPLGDGFYSDWAANYGAFVRGVPGALTNDSDTALNFTRGGASGADTPAGSFTNDVFVPHASPLTTLVPPFTVECWFYPTNVNSQDIWAQFGDEGLNAGNAGGNVGIMGGVRLVWLNGTTPGFQIFNLDDGVQYSAGFATTSSSINTWYHLVLTCDANTNFSLWVNGVLENSSLTKVTGNGAGTYTPDYWTPLTIGGGRGGTRAVAGYIDEFAVYTNAITNSIILTHYYDAIAGKPGQYFSDVQSANPVIYLRMDASNYLAPATNFWPTLFNYGSAGINGLYTPGTVPGILPGPITNANDVPFNGLSGNVSMLSGVSSFADAGYAPAFNPTGTTPFSVSAMFRGNPCDNRFQDIVGHSDNSWRIAMNVNGHLQCSMGIDPSNVVNSAGLYNDGNWHQAVDVYTPASNPNVTGTNSLYVDGVLDTTVTGVNTNGIGPGTNQDVMIGSDPQYTNTPVGVGREFAGEVCDVALFTNALNAGEVSALYDAALNPSQVPAYVAPEPPLTVTLAPGGSLSLTAGAAGTSQVGYLWQINTNGGNSAVLQSGAGNSPFNANLTVPSVPLAWNGGQLELTVTNSYGTNSAFVTLSVVAPSVNPNPTNIVATVTNNNLYLTWPADHTGWQLQAQTNSVRAGIGTNWANYNPSTGTNQVVIPVNLTNGTVFYRLTY